jgi:hypothetical protein
VERGPGVTRPGPGTAGSSLLSGNRRSCHLIGYLRGGAGRLQPSEKLLQLLPPSKPTCPSSIRGGEARLR